MIHITAVEPDEYPEDWNRVYEGGKLVHAFPPIDAGGGRFVGNRFYDPDHRERLPRRLAKVLP